MAMLAKLRNAAPFNCYIVCFKVPKLGAHVIVFVPNTEDVEHQVAAVALVFPANLGLDISIPCRNPQIFVSDKYQY